MIFPKSSTKNTTTTSLVKATLIAATNSTTKGVVGRTVKNLTVKNDIYKIKKN